MIQLLCIGTGVYAFVVLKDGVTSSNDEVETALKNLIRTQIGSFALPQAMLVRGEREGRERERERGREREGRK